MVAFTGSTPTGQSVMRSAAANMKRVTLELGGNDAAIVLPDVDVDKLAPCVSPFPYASFKHPPRPLPVDHSKC